MIIGGKGRIFDAVNFLTQRVDAFILRHTVHNQPPSGVRTAAGPPPCTGCSGRDPPGYPAGLFVDDANAGFVCTNRHFFDIGSRLTGSQQFFMQRHGGFYRGLGVELSRKEILNSTFSIT